jgi:DNA-binding transcriptional LysR family regulator
VEIRQLTYFLTVAEELHFGRAAARLHIVQSAVSQQVQRLERELGVELFDRSTRTVALTPAGELLLPHAREVCAAIDRATSAVARHRADQATTVRLGSSSGVGHRLDTIFTEFNRLVPDSRLELITAATAERITMVRDRALDASLLRGEHDHPELEMLELWRDEMVAALPAHRPPAQQQWDDPLDLADLAALPLRIVARERNRVLFDLVSARCRAAGFEPVLGPEFTTAQDVLATIGFGSPSWTVFYRSHAEQLNSPGVVFRSLGHTGDGPTTYLAVRAEPPPTALRALIEACHRAAGAAFS